MVACRGCVGDRACGRGYKTLGVHVRLPARERGDGAAVRATGATNVHVARSTLRESVPTITGTVRGRGLSVRRRSKIGGLYNQGGVPCKPLQPTRSVSPADSWPAALPQAWSSSP